MSRLDRLIYRELIGIWIFGVLIFTVLIFASVLLVRITNWVVQGIPVEAIMQLVMLLLPGIVVKTFSMAMLLSGLLAFGRLSNDSELVAIRASGASLFRVMRPVFVFSLIVALVSFAVNEMVVPGATYRATAVEGSIRQDLGKTKEARPVHHVLYDKETDRIQAFIGANDIDIANELLLGVHIVSYDQSGRETYVMFADRIKFRGPKDWRVEGVAKLLSLITEDVALLKEGAWPKEVRNPDVTFKNIMAGIASDLDAFSITQIAREIRTMRSDPRPDRKQLNNLEFGFYNKIALPLGVVVFGLLGAPLGIRSHRAGVASGFAISIGLSFAYLIIVNFMAVYSKAGQIPAYAASFAPVALGIVAACITIYRKNT